MFVDDIFVSCSSLVLVSMIFMLWVKYSITFPNVMQAREPINAALKLRCCFRPPELVRTQRMFTVLIVIATFAFDE